MSSDRDAPMIHNLEKILESKRAFRAKMAALPIEEKLRILESLRERELAIRKAMKRVKGDRPAVYKPVD